MATPSTITALADISQYLWTYDIARSNSFYNGTNNMNEGRDIVLLVENAALEWGIENDLDGLQGVANDVYRLCGAKLQEAQEILSTGTGGIVVPPSSGGGVLTPYPINIEVQPSQAGGSTLSALVPTDWVGLIGVVECTIDQNILQLNSQFSYNEITGVFDFSLYGLTITAGMKFTVNSAFKQA